VWRPACSGLTRGIGGAMFPGNHPKHPPHAPALPLRTVRPAPVPLEFPPPLTLASIMGLTEEEFATLTPAQRSAIEALWEANSDARDSWVELRSVPVPAHYDRIQALLEEIYTTLTAAKRP